MHINKCISMECALCICDVCHVWKCAFDCELWVKSTQNQILTSNCFYCFKIYMCLNKWKIDLEIRFLIGLWFRLFIVQLFTKYSYLHAHKTHMQSVEDSFKSTEREEWYGKKKNKQKINGETIEEHWDRKLQPQSKLESKLPICVH